MKCSKQSINCSKTVSLTICVEYYKSHSEEEKILDTWKQMAKTTKLKFKRDNYKDLTFGSKFLTKQKYDREDRSGLTAIVMWLRQGDIIAIWAKLCEVAAKFIQSDVNFSISNLPWHPHDSLISNQLSPILWVESSSIQLRASKKETTKHWKLHNYKYFTMNIWEKIVII